MDGFAYPCAVEIELVILDVLHGCLLHGAVAQINKSINAAVANALSQLLSQAHGGGCSGQTHLLLPARLSQRTERGPDVGCGMLPEELWGTGTHSTTPI
eukprot:364743-Chlamydomonas_euryale.AAC.68